jgi:hypothetical protein
MNRRTFLTTVASAASLAGAARAAARPPAPALARSTGLQDAPAAGARAYPAPQYPSPPRVERVSDLLPNARHIVEREPNNSRPGYGARGGERVLFFVDSYVDPMVVEAFETAFHERGCQIDRIVLDAPRTVWDSADVLELVVRKTPENRIRLWNMRLPYKTDLLDGYDIVVAPDYLPASHVMQHAYGDRDFPMVWPTRELLADTATVQFPEPLVQLIDQKAWDVIRAAERVHIMDPEGTDLTFSIHEAHWAVLEGAHPRYSVSGAKAGRSRVPQVFGHLMGVPRSALPENDAAGVVAGTVDHIGPYPRIEIEVRKGRAVALRGGGRFGDLWREYIEGAKTIQYPHHPAPGCDFLMEGAIGTHPKVRRPHDVMESAAARSAWHYDRRRAGVLHYGFGQADDSEWAEERGLPSSHFHVHQYFSTYSTHLRGGGERVLIDRGRLTVLDDPEVRALAARYGDPDALLTEAWIPAIPGINVPGAYADYAADPAGWFRRDHREHYAV